MKSEKGKLTSPVNEKCLTTIHYASTVDHRFSVGDVWVRWIAWGRPRVSTTNCRFRLDTGLLASGPVSSTVSVFLIL